MRIPGLTDVHVHMREPGGEYKETWATGTAAALAGGVTTVLAMPNTTPPVVDAVAFETAFEAAEHGARCDWGIYVGGADDNAAALPSLASRAAGLKLYLDGTYGPLRLGTLERWAEHFDAWPAAAPLAVHAEGPSLAAAILLSELHDRPVHLCHVSRRDEILLIVRAKERGLRVTCEVTPHHLFLTRDDAAAIRAGGGPGRAEVRPRLADAEDRDALWEHLAAIDIIATDHAPHTRAEKDEDEAPPGFPGVDLALPLLLQAVHDGRLTLDDVVVRMHTNPRRIFGLPEQPDSWVEIDPDARWTVADDPGWSRAAWTPYAGRALHGRVERVVLRGEVAYEAGRVVAVPGSGRDVRERRTPQELMTREIEAENSISGLESFNAGSFNATKGPDEGRTGEGER